MKNRLSIFVLMLITITASLCASGKAELEQGQGTEKAQVELWTFVEAHKGFYEQMAEIWNEENPDRQISLDITVLPNADMHNKLIMALQSDFGAPDICDVHVNQFPNLLKGVPQIEDLSDVIEPYEGDVVTSRLDLYSKDGIRYGVPFHVGASVMYYNTEILDAAGVDYTQIATWDDFIAAGKLVKEKTGKYMNTAEAIRVNMLSAYLGQQGGDFVDADGTPTLDTEKMYKAIAIQKRMLDEGISMVSPGGKPDTEECYGWIDRGEVAAFAFPLWFMSRFVDYMPSVANKIAIAPIPAFEVGGDRSAGVGGTGTIVTKSAKHKELAKEWLAWAKLSEEGGIKVWEILGFDPVNTRVWENKHVINNTDNKYLKYFTTNPFDVLLQIKDEINLIRSVAATPAIVSVFNNHVLLDIYESGKDIRQTLAAAQQEVENTLH
jgi:arabinosaccharide transport system substrate-binding protein